MSLRAVNSQVLSTSRVKPLLSLVHYHNLCALIGWLIPPLEQRQKYSIPCVYFTIKSQRGESIGACVRTSVHPSFRPSASQSVDPSVRCSDWLLDQEQKYSIPCVSFTIKVFSLKAATIKAHDHKSVHPPVRRSVCPSVRPSNGLRSVHRSVRLSVSDGFVMLLLFGLLRATYGRGSGLVFRCVLASL